VNKKRYLFVASLALLSLLLANAIPAVGAFAVSSPNYILEVQLNLEPGASRQWLWGLEHIALRSFWDLREGDSGLTRFRISVYQERPRPLNWISASPVITNPDPRRPAVLQEVYAIRSGRPVDIYCGIRYPYILKPGESVNCTIYAQRSAEGALMTVGARTVGAVGSGSASAPVIYGAYQEFNQTVRVSVAGVGEWTFSESGSVIYEETYSCNEDAGVHSKTARIIETDQQAIATVQIDCFER
jgi:hypothetical protein